MPSEHGIDDLSERRGFGKIQILYRRFRRPRERMERRAIRVGRRYGDQAICTNDHEIEQRLIESEVSIRMRDAKHEMAQALGQISGTGIHVM